MHGNFHKYAILNASNNWPWFDAPSPYNDRQTPPFPLYLHANATPAPNGHYPHIHNGFVILQSIRRPEKHIALRPNEPSSFSRIAVSVVHINLFKTKSMTKWHCRWKESPLQRSSSNEKTQQNGKRQRKLNEEKKHIIKAIIVKFYSHSFCWIWSSS